MYIDRALNEERDGPLFPFWCSLALEFLGRAAIAIVSPTLLAEPDKDHVHLLYALGKGSPKKGPKSIHASLVFSLCKQLVPNFGPEEGQLCESLANRRNEELHSGGLPFESLPPDWVSSFYATSQVLLVAQSLTLDDFLGKTEAKAAAKMIAHTQKQVLEKVKKSISAHKTTFEEKDEKEKKELLGKSELLAKSATATGGHRVSCPACAAKTWVTGEMISGQEAKFEGGQIVERSAMLPTSFKCVACGLKLSGHSELNAAGVGGQFTRSVRYDPIEYYGEYQAGEEYNND